jgi:hypothetical protein
MSPFSFYSLNSFFGFGLAQIEGTDIALETAAKHSWEAVVIVVVLVFLLGVVGTLLSVAVWSIKHQRKVEAARDTREHQREQILMDRVTSLEGKIEEKLLSIVETSTQALGASTAALAENSAVLRHTNECLDTLKAAVIETHRDQIRLLARIEASPCVARSLMSPETRETFDKLEREANEQKPKTDPGA